MKKFFASLLGVVVFFLLVPTCTIFIARDLVSEKTIEKILEVAPEIVDDESNGETIAESIISKVEEYDPVYAEVLDEERLQKEFVKLIASLFESLGNPESEYIFDTSGMKEYMKEVAEEYEDEMNITISESELQEILSSFDEINESKEEWTNEFKEVLILFEAVYSNELLVTLMSLIVLCIILMFIILRDISTTLLKVKTPFMVNGIGTLLIGYGIYSLLKATEMNGGPVPIDLVKVVTTPFYTTGFICVGIAIVLIILSKVLKHNKSISNSNAALENLGNVNYIPNNNITNTPYNGYQNH